MGVTTEIAARALDIAYAQLRSQKDDLRTLRGQAQISAAVSGLVASAFAGLAKLNSDLLTTCYELCFLGISVTYWFPLVCLFCAVGSAAIAVISWKECCFDLNPHRLVYAARTDQKNFEFFCEMAEIAEQNFKRNEVVLDNVKMHLLLSFSFSMLQFPAWMFLIFAS